MPLVAGRPLLHWFAEPSADKGIRFARHNGDWEFWSYQRLAHRARRVACGLVRVGVREHGVVGILQRSSPDFVASLFGAMLAGAVASPMAPPMAFRDRAVYHDHFTRLMESARPEIVLADADLVDQAKDIVAQVDSPMIAAVDAIISGDADGGRAPDRWPAALALLQFTSGSSGTARSVRVPFDALEANVKAICRWLKWTTDDTAASWLPVHHDLGLVGCLITSIVSQSDLWLMQPEDFIRDPLSYLRCFGEAGARLSAMPNFGLNYIARRIKPEALRGMDFSRWRAVVVGAERLDSGAFNRFLSLLGPFGFHRRSILPAYGLAEATLAVTGVPLADEWICQTVEPARLSLGESVVVLEKASLGREVVGCGRPLTGVSVRIADEAGRSLLEGRVGEIIVRGKSVAAGYGDDSSTPVTRFVDNVLHTGDAGFILDGQLFVLGRLGDSLKVRGRAVFAEDVEAALSAIGVPSNRVAAALGVHQGRPTVVVVFERSDDSWLAEARKLLGRRVDEAELVLIDAPRGTIPRTSSGKVKRRQLWRLFVDGGSQLERLEE